MKRDAWVEAHPYLQPIARFQAQVESAAAGIDFSGVGVPGWDDYASEFGEGLPLLQSHAAAVELAPANARIVAVIDQLAASSLPGKLGDDARRLAAELRREPDAAKHLVDGLLGETTFAPSSPGLLRYLGWTALARCLQPVVRAFASWRSEERWMRNYCPTCGAPPAMAQLLGVDPERTRWLACGHCGTRWRYKRTACPFCETDVQRLAVVAIEREALRIDYCESCRGYLKTYAGQGDEPLFLADWTSLHVDLVAHDRGLKRVAGSLYELDDLLASPNAARAPKG